MLYQILKHAHTGIRWIALFLLFASIVNSVLQTRKSYSLRDKKLNSLTIIFLHTQVLIGLFLYFLSPKVIFSTESMSNKMLRFFLIEHPSIMIIAVIVATVGQVLSKKAMIDSNKHMRIIIFFGIALILFLHAIPWPWQNYSSAWF